MQTNSRAIGFIFARGGSKGLPRKNVKLLAGKPLIAHSIETALACKYLETVIVSTDDDEIAAVAREYGAETPFKRPPELASDTASEWDAWRHAINWVQAERGNFDVFVSMPATSPFRDVIDIENCIQTLQNDSNTDMVITTRQAERNPYFNMVSLDKDGYASVVIKPESTISRRQDVPEVFDVTTVAYASRPSFILNHRGVLSGKVRTVLVPAERALDIDTPYDFMIAEFLAAQKSKSQS